MSVKKGDTVEVLAGKDRGKSGKVLRVFPKDNRVLVEGVNMVKRHRRATQGGEKGQIVNLARPIHRSNVRVK